MPIKYIKSSTIKNKSVILRPDLNCPIEKGKVGDDFRIVQSLPTIELLLKGKNKLIICGHLGRPKGQWKEEFSFRPVAKHLANILKLKFVETDDKLPEYGIPHLIFYTGDLRQEKHREQIKNALSKDIVFLENMRFYEEEEKNDKKFAKSMAGMADVFVLDGFGVAHHPAVYVTGIGEHLPSYSGLLLEKEIKSLDAVLKHAKQPLVVMTGGIKLTEKVGTLQNLGKKADIILVGGGVANLMFKNKGYEIGLSKIEEGEDRVAWQIMKNFKNKIIFPVDVVVANKNMDKSSIRVCLPHEVSPNEQILDAGPKTIMEYSKHLKAAKTIVWSGPLGLYEKRPFHHASFALARLIGGRGKGKAFVVAGGGDTLDVIRQTHQFDHIDHVSTGGGAMLEYLAGEKLDGIEALK
jgi:3-phosphoglycerate kinase